MSSRQQTEILRKIDAIGELLNHTHHSIEDSGNLKDLSFVEKAKIIKYNNSLRYKLFPEIAPCNPLWRMLIELYIIDFQSKKISVTDAAVALDIPSTTMLRYIDIAIKNRLIVKSSDPHDKRRSWMNLTKFGIVLVEKSLQDFGKIS